ncbi:MAG: 30S ribosomal protein S8 [Candidatus Dojkabacteria bacterium]|jgi:small subunit ribosomal protein S8
MNDLIADLLARIQNGIMRKKDTVLVVNTNMNRAILEVLKNEKMIGNYEENGNTIEVELLYENNESVLTKLTRISKPGQRIYVSKKEIKPVMNGRGISIISTSEGLMSGALAKSRNLGGELICEVW